MDDVDATLGDVSGKPCLVGERRDASECGDVVLEQRNAAFVELADETSPPPHAGELEIEAAGVEGAPQRHELGLGAAAHQRRHDIQQTDATGITRPASDAGETLAWRGRERDPHRYRASSAEAALSSATQAFRRATARPATQKK